MTNAFKEIGLRIQGLREACDVTREEMAAELEVPVETYIEWEETGKTCRFPPSTIWRANSA